MFRSVIHVILIVIRIFTQLFSRKPTIPLVAQEAPKQIEEVSSVVAVCVEAVPTSAEAATEVESPSEVQQIAGSPIVHQQSATVQEETVACRNFRHPVTRQPCTNQVPISNCTWGLCKECTHACPGCGRLIPVFYSHCKMCKQTAVKPCKGRCGKQIPAVGPLYCGDCGHQCAGVECSAVIPKSFKYCMATACQDAKWLEDHPAGQLRTRSLGAALTRARKQERAEKDRDLRERMRGPSNGRKK